MESNEILKPMVIKNMFFCVKKGHNTFFIRRWHLLACIVTTCLIPRTYAASPGLPLLEDFTDITLMDKKNTTASWSTEDKVVRQAFQSGRWQSTNKAWSKLDIKTGIPEATNIVFGDMNNDGLPDIILGNQNQPNCLLLNMGNGSFSDKIIIENKIQHTNALALGDLNGDGYPDLVVGNSSDVNKFYLNNNNGGFEEGVGLSKSVRNTYATALGDVNGDGFLDIVFCNYGEFNLYLNNGDGTFDIDNFTETFRNTKSIKLGDINGDTYLDIVTGNWAQPNRIYINDGKGGFYLGYDVTQDNYDTTSIALGDINNDGMLDVICGNYGKENRVYINKGKRKWKVENISDDAYMTSYLALGDLDGNGAIDIVTADESLAFHYYLNDGNGSFSKSELFCKEAQTPLCVAISDINADGRLDVVGGNKKESLSLFLNNGCANTFLGCRGIPMRDLYTDTTSLAHGDFNRDGYLDIVAGNMKHENLIYVNDGNGYFLPRVLTNKIHNTSSVATGDLNRDGLLDIVAGNMHEDIALYLNMGNDAWEERSLSFDNGMATSVAVGDMNGDDFPDIVVGSMARENQLFLNKGNGTFEMVSDITDDIADTFSIALGDMNGNGLTDVVAGNYGSKNRLYLNSGGIQPFAHVNGLDIGKEAYGTRVIAVGDVNADNHLDLVEGNYNHKNCIYLNNGTGNPFDEVTTIDISEENYDTNALALGDFDGDGDIDIFCGNDDQEDILYLNDGTQPPFSDVVGRIIEEEKYRTIALTAADFDNNNALDIITGLQKNADRYYLNPGNACRTYALPQILNRSVQEGTTSPTTGKRDISKRDSGPVVTANACPLPISHFDFSKNMAASKNINLPDQEITEVSVDFKTVCPPNTSLDFYLTNNGGALWIQVQSGQTVCFPTPGDKLRWKAVLHSLSSLHSAQLVQVNLDIPNFTIEYQTEGTPSAELDGDTVQNIQAGKDATPVTAVFPPGWCFTKWDCGDKNYLYENPVIITNVKKDLVLTAVFSKEIQDFAELQKIGRDPEYPAHGNYCLVQDIDASKTNNPVPIGSQEDPFTGCFSGNDHSIYGFNYGSEIQQHSGLFGYVGEGAEIRDLVLTDVNIPSDGTYVGGIAGINNGLIINCHVSGRFIYDFYTDFRGALAAVNGSSGIIRDSSAIMEILTQGNYIGAIAGKNYGSIENCFSSGTVSGNSKVGGVVGGQEGGTLLQCFSNANVGATLGEAGGTAGSSSSGTFTRCFASGNVVCSSGFAGGLIGMGFGVSMRHCFALGNVTAEQGQPGALAGALENSSLDSCYAAGRVTGNGGAGLLTFQEGTKSTFVNCFWDRETTHCDYATSRPVAIEGALGKTTAEMLSEESYANWDFSPAGPFSIIENKTYPFLKFKTPEAHIQRGESFDEDTVIFNVSFTMPVPRFDFNDLNITYDGVEYLSHLITPLDTGAINAWSVAVIVTGEAGSVSAQVNLDGLPGSETVTATIFSGAPADVLADTILADSISYTWRDTSDNEDGFYVYFGKDEGRPERIEVPLPADTSEYTIEGLTPNTVYTFQVSAKNGSYESIRTKPLMIRTLVYPPVKPILTEVTINTICAAIGSGDNNPPSTEYALRISPAAEDNCWVQPGGKLGKAPAWQTANTWGTVTLADLREATQYTFVAVAHNGESIETAPGPGESGYTQCRLEYTAAPGGAVSVTGDAVNYGTDGPLVMALPQPGYCFSRWSDGNADNPRQDKTIVANIAVQAAFAPLFPGSGTAGAPYNIMTVEQLQELRQLPDKRFMLMNDIDASAAAEWNNGAGFQPIGSTEKPFTGTLDGRGYVISGLSIRRPGENNIGLFGATGPGARLMNIALHDAVIVGKENVGALVGYEKSGTALRCDADGVVKGEINTGGLFGKNENGTAEFCRANCRVEGGANVGGLSGSNTDSIFNCCYTLGSAVGERNVGGLTGYNHQSSIRDSYSRCRVSGNKCIGGLLGYNQDSIVHHGYAAELVEGKSGVGGLVGFNNSGELESTYWDIEATKQIISYDANTAFGKHTQEMKTSSTFETWDFESVWAIQETLSYPYLRAMPE